MGSLNREERVEEVNSQRSFSRLVEGLLEFRILSATLCTCLFRLSYFLVA